MKKLLAVCLLLVALAVSCGGGETIEFEFKHSDFSYATGGSVYFGVLFTAIGYEGDINRAMSAWQELTLKLRHPDSTETEAAERHYCSTSFLMSSGFEAPKAGQYTLTVEDQSGKLVDTYTFDFTGPSMSVNNVSLTWAWVESPGCYTLKEADFLLLNSGDLPIWIAAIDICIEDTCQTAPPLTEDPARFLESAPGRPEAPGTLSFFNTVNIGGISPGEKTLSIEIRDSAGKVVCSYSSVVTPA
jgi:hypothetical protein